MGPKAHQNRHFSKTGLQKTAEEISRADTCQKKRDQCDQSQIIIQVAQNPSQVFTGIFMGSDTDSFVTIPHEPNFVFKLVFKFLDLLMIREFI